jgi:hypothetical protein
MFFMHPDFDEIVYSEHVIAFTTLANEYCSFLDQVATYSQKAFVDKAHRLLPLIYIKALSLPETAPVDPDIIDKTVTQEEWEEVCHAVARKLGKYDTYKEVFDPLHSSEDPMTSLSEGFADIFQDLKDYLALFSMGSNEMMNDAIWECQKNFCEYWGQRLVNILRILHYLKYNQGNLNTNDGRKASDYDPMKQDTSSWAISRRQNEFREEDDE